jgi:hypothetical protein
VSNLFKAQVVGMAAVERALGLSYEAGLYKRASAHEEAKDVLWPNEEEKNDEGRRDC